MRSEKKHLCCSSANLRYSDLFEMLERGFVLSGNVSSPETLEVRTTLRSVHLFPPKFEWKLAAWPMVGLLSPIESCLILTRHFLSMPFN